MPDNNGRSPVKEPEGEARNKLAKGIDRLSRHVEEQPDEGSFGQPRIGHTADTTSPYFNTIWLLLMGPNILLGLSAAAAISQDEPIYWVLPPIALSLLACLHVRRYQNGDTAAGAMMLSSLPAMVAVLPLLDRLLA
ncbi:MAG: hypothetical protein P8Q36_00965 [Alphaproteobacteria bacterium]|jgi:hypothetical protein|nr:hypothetical protein [Rhodospirillaceae bacterium]MDG2479426.1 hypothetical protein [Alphaproteobacteria bacterium]MBT6204779.1 hypothetical protein [Rhodospirillaceae bacterium]MBT6510193.1 hypothetical protein [Rhodospirillaceae bacterium]MBT7613319.1 hypothetical protein [Rhodospirillaceae bacterium]